MAEGTQTNLSGAMRGSASHQFSNLLGNATAIFSAGAGAIHIAVIQAHLEEYWAFGVFFAVVAWLQILWAIWVVARPSRVVALTGIGINGAITAVWVVSRTVGVPLGPEPGVAEPVEFVDVAATSLQVLAIMGALGLLSRGAMRRDVGRGTLVSSTLVLGVSVAVLATGAIISFEPHEEEEPAATDEHEEEEGEAGSALGSMFRLSASHGLAV
jgi:hypothetical protein